MVVLNSRIRVVAAAGPQTPSPCRTKLLFHYLNFQGSNAATEISQSRSVLGSITVNRDEMTFKHHPGR
jgi:hypothetical protein